jgi:hypothetical protein
MGKTVRRINYEKTLNSKIRGSKISGKGYYTQENYEYYNHPTFKVKNLVYVRGPFGAITYDWAKSGRTYPVAVPYYTEFDIQKFYKEYHSLHGDSHFGEYSVPKWYRRFKNKKLKMEFKEYVYRESNGLKEIAIPKFVKDAYWDYS